MTKSGNLIPEARADKNGKTTVRWIKPESGSATLKQALPAPTLPEPDLPKLRSEVARTMGISARLENLGADTLGMVLAYADADKDIDNLCYWANEYGNKLNGAFGENYLREILTYQTAFSADSSPRFIEKAVGELGAYKRLPRMDDYSRAEPELKRFIHGLLSLTCHLYSDWFNEHEESVPRYIENESLMNLIFDNPDKVELIKSVVIERKTENVETIRAVLDSGTVALGEGAL